MNPNLPVMTAIVCVILLASAASSQTTWYVDASATSPGVGSQISPFTSIQAGINASVNGDTVLVGSGTYNEPINFNGREITVWGTAGAASTTVDPLNTSVNVVTLDSGETRAAVLRGFTITGGGVGVACLSVGSTPALISAVTLEDCVITGNNGAGVACENGTGQGLAMVNCDVYSNGDAGLDLGSTLGSSGNFDLTDCLIHDNALHGVGVTRAGLTVDSCEIFANGGLGILENDHSGIDVAGTLIWGNAGGGVHVGCFAGGTINTTTISGNGGSGITVCDASIMTVQDSIVWGTISLNGAFLFGSFTVDYCDLQGALPSFATGSNNISLDPLFVSTATGSEDFHLQSCSPCIGSASNGSDMGAFPYVVVAPVVTSITPNSAPAGTSSFVLSVSGTGFNTKSEVHWDGAPLTTTCVSDTLIQASTPVLPMVPGTIQVTVDNPGTGGGISNSIDFTVTSGVAAKLVFDTAPTSPVIAGAVWSAFTVRIEDTFGNLVATATDMVTITLVTGVAPLNGTLSKAAVGGIATFDDLTYNVVEAITFDVTASGLTGIIGTMVSVDHGPPSALGYVIVPSSPVTAGVVWPTFTVQIEDAFGNLVPTAMGFVAVALTNGVGPLNGTLIKATIGGIATFDTLSYNAAEVITFDVTSSGFTGIIGTGVTVDPAAALALSYVTTPTSPVTAGIVWPAFTVGIEDAFGNLVTTATGMVTVTLMTGVGSLNGTLSNAAVGGIATFDDLTYNVAEAIAFDVTAMGLTGIGAVGVTVNPGATSALGYGTTPTSPVTAGVIWTPFTVRILDAFGNLVPTATDMVTVTLNAGVGPLNGTLSNAAVGGIATFDTLSYNVAEVITFNVTALGFAGIIGTGVTVDPAAPSALFYNTLPTSPVAVNSPWPAFTVRIEDIHGNLATTAVSTVTVSSVGGAGTLGGTLSLPAVGGVATFFNLTYSVPSATPFTLNVSAPGVTGITGTLITVLQGPILTSLLPAAIAPITTSTSIQVTIFGAGLIPGTSLVYANGQLVTTLPALSSTTQLKFLIDNSVSQVAAPGGVAITVRNPPSMASNTVALDVEVSPGVAGDNVGTIVFHPLGYSPGQNIRFVLEGVQTDVPFTLMADAAAPVPIVNFPTPTGNSVLGVIPGSPTFLPILDGIGLFGLPNPLLLTQSSTTGTQPGGIFLMPPFLTPNPPSGVSVSLQVAYADPTSSNGWRLSWTLNPLDL